MFDILSTKILPKELQKSFFNIANYTQYDAIRISHNQIEIPHKIENAIITSKNAFEAASKNTMIENAYCVGDKTAQLLSKHHINIACKANYAADLADKIIAKHQNKKFVFLSGNLRKDILVEKLKNENIGVEEFVVYQTDLNQKKFNQSFNGILFFSPSTVKSYYRCNTPKNEIAFCIGKTTANEAKKYMQKIKIAQQPSYHHLVKEVINYYKK